MESNFENNVEINSDENVTVLALQNEYNFEVMGDINNVKGLKWAKVIADHPDLYPRISDLERQSTPLKERIYPFTGTAMEYGLLEDIKNEIINSISSNVFKEDGLDRNYVSPIKNYLYELHNISVEDGEILLGKDIITLIQNAIEVTTSINDGVIIMPPISNSYKQVIQNSKRRVIECPLIYNETSNLYEIDYAKLEELLKDKLNRGFILNNPQNPIAKNFDREELEQLLDILNKNSIQIISDESYFDFISNESKHESILTFNKIKSIMISSATKTFNFDTLGGAYAIIVDNDLRNKYRRSLWENAWFNSNQVSKVALETAYTRGIGYARELNKHVNNNRKYLEKFISENLPSIQYTKGEGTYFQWLNFVDFKMDKNNLDKFLRLEASLYLDEIEDSRDQKDNKNGNIFYRMNIACPWFILDKQLRTLKEAFDRREEERKNPLIKIKRSSGRAMDSVKKSITSRLKGLFKRD